MYIASSPVADNMSTSTNVYKYSFFPYTASLWNEQYKELYICLSSFVAIAVIVSLMFYIK